MGVKDHFTTTCWFRGLWLFLILCLSAPSVVAQDYFFRHLTTRNGVAGGYINDIKQDDRGFIWVATNTGMSKFDGYTFTNFRSNSDFSSQLSNNNVTRIIHLPDNRLLISHGSGLDLMKTDTETFRPLRFPSSFPETSLIRDMTIDESGDLWMISDDYLYHFPKPDMEADTLQGTFFEVSTETEDNFAFRSLEIYRGEVWLGSTRDISIFNPGSRTFRQITSSDPQTRRILQSINWEVITGPDGNLYMSFVGGFLRYNRNNNRLENLTDVFDLSNAQLAQSGFQDLFVDSENNLWIGTSAEGAFRWNMFTNELRHFDVNSSDENTVNSPDVHLIYEDDQQNIWFGYHFLGTSLMYSQSWNYTFNRPYPNLAEDDSTNALAYVAMDQQSVLWGLTINGLIKGLGTEDARFFEIDREALEIESAGFAVGIIHMVENKLFFVMNQFRDILMFDTETETFSKLNLDLPGVPIALKPVVYGDHVFVGLLTSNQLLRLNTRTFEHSLLDIPGEGPPDNVLQHITQPEFVDGQDLYLKYYQILPGEIQFESFILDPDSLTFRTHNLPGDISLNGFGPPHVSDYQPGVNYFNVTDGLIRINNLTNESQLLFSNQAPLLKEGSGLMVEDNQGFIWLNNQTGLMRLDPLTESISYYEVPAEKRPLNYSIQTKLPNGEIIFPGEGGYIRFNPAELETSQPTGETIISSLQSGSQTYRTIYSSEDITLVSGDNNLTFNFIGMNFRDPSSTHYRYRILGGENEQWNLLGAQRSVFVPNLPSGNYTFEVQSGSQFGTFNEESATLSFAILPPWWNTWPAYFLYVLLLAGLIFGVDRVQRRRVLFKEKERNRQKEVEQARKIEKAYHELEQAHEQLKSAQEQLVQQEKLASLGQLTAGIAHEIKNPLNFVNNFSDLSVELIQEVRDEFEELKKQLPKEDQQKLADATEALVDIESNLKKIHEHGSRADRIVKSMLQHSRGGSGRKEKTDLNALLMEYVNLAFHGMRAGKEPINVDIQFKLEPELPQLPLIAEDFSRVIVNLCNNAFDAMRQKQSALSGKSDEKYQPSLTTVSRMEKDTVIIEIRDNGPGIPEKIREHILQPFFTTKKGTEGTGLGLSITNDIIKAHGGEISIETETGEGTTFILTLSK